jgi:biopolymer transport protein ExbD
MAQINASNESPGRKRAGVRRMIKHTLKVDMTPMVDLGFLLITFFVMTAELKKPTTMSLYMPKDGGPPIELENSNALTVMIGNGKIYYYHGDWKEAFQNKHIYETNLAGKHDLRKIIGDKQRKLDNTPKLKEGRDGLMMLIKAGNDASYKTLVDVLDETTISMVKKYALVKLTPEEANWLKTQ